MIKKVDTPENKRVIAISDVHAHCGYLRELLKKVNFTQRDMLFLIGDYIEKGCESLETLRYVMELCKGFDVHATLGNIDLWRYNLIMSDDAKSAEELLNSSLNYHKEFGTSFYHEICAELNIDAFTVDKVLAVRPVIRKHLKAELDFLGSLPLVIDAGSYSFVHGGLPCEDFESLKDFEPFRFLKFDKFTSAGLNFKTPVVVGHWPVCLIGDEIFQLNPVVDRQKNIFSIDGGCGVKLYGQLNALIIEPSGELCFQSFDHFPCVTALESQEPTKNPRYFPWSPQPVELLEVHGEFCSVKKNGAVIEYPFNRLYEWDEKYYCDDYTDNLLEVKKGDRIKILFEYSQGVIVKKDGVIGWYKGKYK